MNAAFGDLVGCWLWSLFPLLLLSWLLLLRLFVSAVIGFAVLIGMLIVVVLVVLLLWCYCHC